MTPGGLRLADPRPLPLPEQRRCVHRGARRSRRWLRRAVSRTLGGRVPIRGRV